MEKRLMTFIAGVALSIAHSHKVKFPVLLSQLRMESLSLAHLSRWKEQIPVRLPTLMVTSL